MCTGTREEEVDGRAAGYGRGCAGATWNETRGGKIKRKKEIIERDS